MHGHGEHMELRVEGTWDGSSSVGDGFCHPLLRCDAMRDLALVQRLHEVMTSMKEVEEDV